MKPPVALAHSPSNNADLSVNHYFRRSKTTVDKARTGPETWRKIIKEQYLDCVNDYATRMAVRVTSIAKLVAGIKAIYDLPSI